MNRTEIKTHSKRAEVALDPVWKTLVEEIRRVIPGCEFAKARHRLHVHIPSGTPAEIRVNIDPDSLFMQLLVNHPEILKVPDHTNSHPGHDYFLSMKNLR